MWHVKYMVKVRLKRNKDKAEFIVVSSHLQPQVQNFMCKTGQDVEKFPLFSCYLAVIFHWKLDVMVHNFSVCETSFFLWRNTGTIRKFPFKDAYKKWTNAVVVWKQHYCNSPLVNLTKFQHAKFQEVQNVTFELKTSTKSGHIPSVLKERFWYWYLCMAGDLFFFLSITLIPDFLLTVLLARRCKMRTCGRHRRRTLISLTKRFWELELQLNFSLKTKQTFE